MDSDQTGCRTHFSPEPVAPKLTPSPGAATPVHPSQPLPPSTSLPCRAADLPPTTLHTAEDGLALHQWFR